MTTLNKMQKVSTNATNKFFYDYIVFEHLYKSLQFIHFLYHQTQKKKQMFNHNMKTTKGVDDTSYVNVS